MDEWMPSGRDDSVTSESDDEGRERDRGREMSCNQAVKKTTEYHQPHPVRICVFVYYSSRTRVPERSV